MTILEGVIQGVIQGLTEFLPVSSDGHLALFQHFFNLSGENALFLTIMLHAGTLAAVFIAFRKTIVAYIQEGFCLIGDVCRGKFDYQQANENRRAVIMILISLIPLAGFYFVKDFFTTLSEDQDIIVEGLCFFFTGILLYLTQRCSFGEKHAKDMTVKDAMIIGFFQGFAALPGVSRSGSTISVGLLRGFSRDFMVSFSFIMSIPAILGVCLNEVIDVIRFGVEIDWIPMTAGMLTAFFVGLAAIRLVQSLVNTNRFGLFSYYTTALGLITLVIGAAEKLF